MCDVSQNDIQGTQSIQKPRILYLDVDDTILVWTNDIGGFGAPRAAEFITWALEHFEVRWLTMWCPSGKLRREGAEELSYRLGGKIEPEVFQNISNPRSFTSRKTDGIDFDDPRPWVWVEDGILSDETHILKQRDVHENHYPTHVTKNVVALQKTWRLLAERFNLPGGPGKVYSKELDQPTVTITVQDILDKFRNGKMQSHDVYRPPEVILPDGWKSL